MVAFLTSNVSYKHMKMTKKLIIVNYCWRHL